MYSFGYMKWRGGVHILALLAYQTYHTFVILLLPCGIGHPAAMDNHGVRRLAAMVTVQHVYKLSERVREGVR